MRLGGLKVALVNNSVCIHNILETVMIIDTLCIQLGKERDTKDGLRGPRRGSGGPRWLKSESYFPSANLNLFCFIQWFLSSLKVANFC